MSFTSEKSGWETACIAYDNNDIDTAMRTFIDIANGSKVHFNIGLIFTEIGRHDHAIASYLQALKFDPYMVVARFQLGVSYFLKGDMELAVENFTRTYEQLRGNKIVDYQQLGLSFLLYSCEVLFNRGICQLYLGKMDAGLTDLYYAQKVCVTAEHSIVEQAVRDQGKGYSVFSIPPGVLFRPPEDKLKLLLGNKFSMAMEQLVPKKSIAKSNSILLKQRQPSKSTAAKTFQTSPQSIPSRFFSRTSDSQDSLSLIAKSKFFRSADSGFDSPTEDKHPCLPTGNMRVKSAYGLTVEEDEGYGDFDKELDEVYGTINKISLNSERQWCQQNWKYPENKSVTSGLAENIAYGKIKIKVHYKDTRVLLVSSNVMFEDLRAKIQEKFNIPNTILLQYKDEESELVLLLDNDDLQIARQVYRYFNTKADMEKLELWCVDK